MAVEHDLRLVEFYIIVLVSGRPMLLNMLECHVKHFEQRIVIGKEQLVFGNPPKLVVEPFDNIVVYMIRITNGYS